MPLRWDRMALTLGFLGFLFIILNMVACLWCYGADYGS